MRRKKSSIVLLIIVLSLGSAAFGAMALINHREIVGYLPIALKPADSKSLIAETKNPTNQPIKNESFSPAVMSGKDSVEVSTPGRIPIQIAYLFLFKRVADLDKRATDEEAKGKDGKIYRQHYKNKAKITDEQNAALFKVAKDCLAETSKKDDEAQKIIDKDRAKYPGGKIKPGEPFPTPPVELTTLKQERDAIVLRHLDVFKTNFSQADFIKFQQFVEREITAQISTTTLTKDLRPEFSAAGSVKQVSPDSAINPSSKQSEVQK